jgi:CRISPR/Cas system-associated protein Cas10 (large subunit of type III CRISPR-Cas system)
VINKIKVKCKHCGNEIEKIKAEYERRIKKKAVGFFCNLKCSGSFFNAKHLEKYQGDGSHFKGYQNNRLDQYSPFNNIKMEISRTSQDEDIKKTPTKASLDRIDPSIGYIKGNVEFVCYCINVMKNDFTKEQMIDFINQIKNI